MVKGTYLIVILVVISFFLSGCTSFQTHGIENAMKREIDIREKSIPSGHFMGEIPIIPIDLEGEHFHSVGDWYNETSILYIVDQHNRMGSNIYRYHLYTGEKELFFETPHQIIGLEGSENNNYFAIHTSSSINEANLVIIDKKGKEVVNWPVVSTELQYVWNPFDETKLFITSFQEDWSFKNFVLDLDTQKIKESDITQPFIQWLSDKEVLYLKWDEEFQENTAPLYSYHLENKSEEEISEQVLGFHTYQSMFMTVSPKDNQSIYQFLDPDSKSLKQSFTLPNIETYSDRWWIPNYDYNKKQDLLLVYKPIMKEQQFESLQLVTYSLQSAEESVVLQGVEDRPLLISPDGELSLIGYQFEEILDLRTNKLQSILE